MDSFEAAEAKRQAKMRSLLPARGEIKWQTKSQHNHSTEVDDDADMDDYLQDDSHDLSRDISNHPNWPVRGYSSRHEKSNAEKKRVSTLSARFNMYANYLYTNTQKWRKHASSDEDEGRHTQKRVCSRPHFICIVLY